jgi:hypothetical protein
MNSARTTPRIARRRGKNFERWPSRLLLPSKGTNPHRLIPCLSLPRHTSNSRWLDHVCERHSGKLSEFPDTFALQHIRGLLKGLYCEQPPRSRGCLRGGQRPLITNSPMPERNCLCPPSAPNTDAKLSFVAGHRPSLAVSRPRSSFGGNELPKHELQTIHGPVPATLCLYMRYPVSSTYVNM